MTMYTFVLPPDAVEYWFTYDSYVAILEVHARKWSRPSV